MFLAEALMERKALSDEIQNQLMLISDSAVVQEGDEKANLDEMLDDLGEMYHQHQALDLNIREANATHRLMYQGESISLIEAIARRDLLKSKSGGYSRLANLSRYHMRQFRRSGSEVKMVELIEKDAMLSLAKAYAASARALDAKIQKRNWEIEL
jgi:hypothetical protein